MLRFTKWEHSSNNWGILFISSQAENSLFARFDFVPFVEVEVDLSRYRNNCLLPQAQAHQSQDNEISPRLDQVKRNWRWLARRFFVRSALGRACNFLDNICTVFVFIGRCLVVWSWGVWVMRPAPVPCLTTSWPISFPTLGAPPGLATNSNFFCFLFMKTHWFA